MNDQSSRSRPRTAAGTAGAPIGLVAGTAAVREGRLKPSAWIEDCLARVDVCEPTVKAFEYLDPEALRRRAAVLDAADWSARTIAPDLAGAPLAVKDIFNTLHMPNSMGSDVRRGYQPGNDARILELAIHRGAIPFGKTTTAEFAVHHEPGTENAWDSTRIAGTSSTGSAVAVACGMTPAALGTQSAGSIIRPASYNGVVGFKPTFGLLPRTGVLKTCDTLDTIGFLTRNVADARLLLDTLRVRGHNYPAVARGFRAAIAQRAGRPWRLGFGAAPGVQNAQKPAVESLELLTLQLGNRPDVDLVELDLSVPLGAAHEAHRVIYHKSLSYYFTRDLAHIDRVSDIFRDIVAEGERFSHAEYLEALETQDHLSEKFETAMDGVDAFITLSTAGEAPARGVAEPDDSALVWTLCGAPAISLPMFRSDHGRPFGAQIVARRYFDYALLDFSASVFPEEAPLATPKGAPAR